MEEENKEVVGEPSEAANEQKGKKTVVNQIVEKHGKKKCIIFGAVIIAIILALVLGLGLGLGLKHNGGNGGNGGDDGDDDVPTPTSAFGFRILDDETCSVSYLVDTSLVEIVVPSEYEGHKVVALSDNAFNEGASGNNVLKKMTLPKTCVTIGSLAFACTTALETLVLRSTTVTISSYAFSESAIKNINYSGTKSQWSTNVTLQDDWNGYATNVITAHCSDGDITF